jgi:hypothetical protein
VPYQKPEEIVFVNVGQAADQWMGTRRYLACIEGRHAAGEAN